MNVGSIPVIISDKYELPFSDLIDWDSCSIRVKEDEVSDLLGIIKRNLDREEGLRENVKKIYDLYFSSAGEIVNTALQLCRERVS